MDTKCPKCGSTDTRVDLEAGSACDTLANPNLYCVCDDCGNEGMVEYPAPVDISWNEGEDE